ncbi:MAG: M81 family metallopeptidase [Alphaproteobacteria bacterium]|nr:M81 family metallopeptidase [Alphaproteobacteria bacterium]
MRLVVAMMKHETNTFSPVPTPFERFGARGAHFGQAARDAYRGTNTPFAAYLDHAERLGADVVTPIAAEAAPSGPVATEAYARMTDAICEAVDKGCDGCLLDLHGAMVAETTDDGEGTLLARIRAIKPSLPIAVALDLHANMTNTMADNATAIVGYKTYPHVDMYKSGEHVGRIVLDAMAGKSRPVMVWGNRPLMPHTLRMATHVPPMKDLIDMAKAAEAGGLLAATAFGGFPLADIPNPGLSVVTIAEADRAAAERMRDAILDAAWARRAEFVYHSEPLAKSVGQAKALSDGPILIIDHADNCASGGTQDTIAVLKEVMRQGLEDVAVFAIVDPRAVDQMIKAGIGARVTVSLGGKMSMPAIGRQGEPMEVSGRVRAVTDGRFKVRGPMATGTTVNMGRTVVLDTGKIEVVVCERHTEPFDLGSFRSVGIEPTDRRYLMLKSRVHYRAGFAPIAKHIVDCDGVGVTSSDMSLFKFEKVRRPIYPLDSDA